MTATADFLDEKAKRDAKLRERLRKAEAARDKANGHAREDGDQAGRNDTGPEPDRAAGGTTATAGDPGWRRRLLESDNGPIACEANVEMALLHAPELVGRLRFNELTGAVECSGLPWHANEGWRAWSDVDDTALAIWCQRHGGFSAKPATCAAAMQLVAADHPHHPVREYLDGLRWDGTPRLGAWLHTYLGVNIEAAVEGATDAERAAAAAKDAFVRQAGQKWLISAVARAFRPGCKADHALIFEGSQGIGKSSALAALVLTADWFADEISDLGSKDSAQDLRGKWIIELAELSAMRRPEVERTKAFMSRAVDHYRPSYGRRSQDFPRQCVFGGTTNSDAYLGDETGNRRFWPVKVGTIKLDALRAVRDQLWGEAVAAYKAGETWWLDAAVEIAAAEQQAERRVVDPWEERVLEWAEKLKEAHLDDGLAVLGVPVERRDQATANRVARVLKANGWERVQRRRGGRKVWGYERPPPVPPVDHYPTGGGSPVEEPSNDAGLAEGATTATSATSKFPNSCAQAGAGARIGSRKNGGGSGGSGGTQADQGFSATSSVRRTGGGCSSTGGALPPEPDEPDEVEL